MNKNYLTVFATAAIALTTGCVTAGTWVNGCYIDGPLCTVCDGMKVITHAYGTTVCTHCDGTGIEPPEETVVVENVFVDTWCPAPLPPPPRWHNHHPRGHREPLHHGGGRHEVRPARPAGGARPKQMTRAKSAPRAKPAPRQARPAAPRGGGGRHGGGRGGRR